MKAFKSSQLLQRDRNNVHRTSHSFNTPNYREIISNVRALIGFSFPLEIKNYFTDQKAFKGITINLRNLFCKGKVNPSSYFKLFGKYNPTILCTDRECKAP